MKLQLLEKRDNWDCVQSMLWSLQLPAANLEEFISRSAPLLIIVRSDDRFILTDNSTGSKFDCASLEEAKDVGDGIASGIQDARAVNLTVSAGLDPAHWTFCYQDRFVWFEKRTEPKAKLERYGANQWVVEMAGKRIGIVGSAIEGAALIAQFS